MNSPETQITDWFEPNSAQREMMVSIVIIKLKKHGVNVSDSDFDTMMSDDGTKLSQLAALLRMWGE